MRIVPVILSGGSGTRLWPLSRALYPKQLLSLVGDKSLLQQTVLRARSIAPDTQPIVVCNHEHRFLVAEQLRTIKCEVSSIILEPVARNTAPAIALAALQAMLVAKDPVILVMPSDHFIKDKSALNRAIQTGLPLVEDGKLVTFGIKPKKPASCYGYIRATDKGVSRVDRFTEKPDVETAEKYIAAGNYYWNSGLFLFQAKSYLAALEEHAPKILETCKAAFKERKKDLEFLRVPEREFSLCPNDSIDYAVMEKVRNTMVVPMQAGWSDLGSWQSLWDVEDKDPHGNVVSGEVVLLDSENCYARSDSGLLGLIGVKEYIVITTADAVLIAHQDRAEEVKQLVDLLKTRGHNEVDLHKRVYRPWGSYEVLDRAEGFKVKRISVKPGASLSLQSHRHRAEHWIVVKGTALVTCGAKQYTVVENESTYIPQGILHRLKNAELDVLELIEVQSGDYLGEDDIIRFEDEYNRQ